MARTQRLGAMGKWARSARHAAGYGSAETVAEATGIPVGWLRSVEAGYITNPSPERIAMLEAIYRSTAPEPEPAEEPVSAYWAAQLEAAFARGVEYGVALQARLAKATEAMGPTARPLSPDDPATAGMLDDSSASSASPRPRPSRRTSAGR